MPGIQAGREGTSEGEREDTGCADGQMYTPSIFHWSGGYASVLWSLLVGGLPSWSLVPERPWGQFLLHEADGGPVPQLFSS